MQIIFRGLFYKKNGLSWNYLKSIYFIVLCRFANISLSIFVHMSSSPTPEQTWVCRSCTWISLFQTGFGYKLLRKVLINIGMLLWLVNTKIFLILLMKVMRCFKIYWNAVWEIWHGINFWHLFTSVFATCID